MRIKIGRWLVVKLISFQDYILTRDQDNLDEFDKKCIGEAANNLRDFINKEYHWLSNVELTKLKSILNKWVGILDE
jgi:hypothetical protein